MTQFQMKGIDWANVSLIHDFSTGQYTFQIHLDIDLGSKERAAEIEAVLRTELNSKVAHAPALKRALKERLVANNVSNASTIATVDSILLRV